MTCNVNIHSIANALLTWEPIGEITGFANGDAAVEIAPSDEGANTMKVSADGRSASIGGNAKRNGKVTVKLEPGSAYIDILANLWQSDKFARGLMTCTDVETGKSYAMECAILENLPTLSMGSAPVDSVDYMFLYKVLTVTPSTTSIRSIAGI